MFVLIAQTNARKNYIVIKIIVLYCYKKIAKKYLTAVNIKVAEFTILALKLNSKAIEFN